LTRVKRVVPGRRSAGIGRLELSADTLSRYDIIYEAEGAAAAVATQGGGGGGGRTGGGIEGGREGKAPPADRTPLVNTGPDVIYLSLLTSRSRPS
jgi:hypothetical protein